MRWCVCVLRSHVQLPGHPAGCRWPGSVDSRSKAQGLPLLRSQLHCWRRHVGHGVALAQRCPGRLQVSPSFSTSQQLTDAHSLKVWLGEWTIQGTRLRRPCSSVTAAGPATATACRELTLPSACLCATCRQACVCGLLWMAGMLLMRAAFMQPHSALECILLPLPQPP